MKKEYLTLNLNKKNVFFLEVIFTLINFIIFLHRIILVNFSIQKRLVKYFFLKNINKRKRIFIHIYVSVPVET